MNVPLLGCHRGVAVLSSLDGLKEEKERKEKGKLPKIKKRHSRGGSVDPRLDGNGWIADNMRLDAPYNVQC